MHVSIKFRLKACFLEHFAYRHRVCEAAVGTGPHNQTLEWGFRYTLG